MNHTIQGRQATLPDPSQKEPIFFDYLFYTPSEKTVFDKNTRFFIDERDSRVNFAKPSPQDWVLQNDGFSYDDFFRGGVTNTTDPENIVTLSFIGTKIEVFGCKDIHLTPRLNFTLDSQSPDIIQLQVEPEYEYRYNVALWESPVVDGHTEHTVRMNHVSGSNGGMCLDYFLVTPATQSPGFFEKAGPPAYAIALPLSAGVLGLIVLVSILIWYIRRRKETTHFHKRSASPEDQVNPHSPGLSFITELETTIVPFTDTASARRIPTIAKSLEAFGTISHRQPNDSTEFHGSDFNEPQPSSWEIRSGVERDAVAGATIPRLQPVRLRLEKV